MGILIESNHNMKRIKELHGIVSVRPHMPQGVGGLAFLAWSLLSLLFTPLSRGEYVRGGSHQGKSLAGGLICGPRAISWRG